MIETDQEHIQRLNKQASDYQMCIFKLEAECARLRESLQEIAGNDDPHEAVGIARAALSAQPNKCSGGCHCDPTSIHDCVCPECRARFVAVQPNAQPAYCDWTFNDDSGARHIVPMS